MFRALVTDVAKILHHGITRAMIRRSSAAREQEHVVYFGKGSAPRLVQRTHHACIFALRELDELIHHFIRLKRIET